MSSKKSPRPLSSVYVEAYQEGLIKNIKKAPGAAKRGFLHGMGAGAGVGAFSGAEKGWKAGSALGIRGKVGGAIIGAIGGGLRGAAIGGVGGAAAAGGSRAIAGGAGEMAAHTAIGATAGYHTVGPTTSKLGHIIKGASSIFGAASGASEGHARMRADSIAAKTAANHPDSTTPAKPAAGSAGHEGEKMVFGQWRKTDGTAKVDHPAYAAKNAIKKKAGSGSGLPLWRKQANKK